MVLVVRQTTNLSSNTNNQPGRDALGRYCIAKNYAYIFSDKYAPIDMAITKPGGITVAIKLFTTISWTTQLMYPENFIDIPRSLWKIFHEQVRDILNKNVRRADDAYLVMLNTLYTRAAFIKLSDILEDLAVFDESVLQMSSISVHVPISYITGYVNIPPITKEL